MNLTEENLATTQSFDACRLTCASDLGSLLPKPSGLIRFSKLTSAFDPEKISFRTNFKDGINYWREAEVRFIKQMNNKLPKNYYLNAGGSSILIEILVEADEMS